MNTEKRAAQLVTVLLASAGLYAIGAPTTAILTESWMPVWLGAILFVGVGLLALAWLALLMARESAKLEAQEARVKSFDDWADEAQEILRDRSGE